MNVLPFVGRDSSVGTGTRYGPEGRGIESRWGPNFQYPSRPALGATQPPIQGVQDFFSRRVKRPGCGVNYPPPSSVEVKERVELYLYFLSGPSWPVVGRIIYIYI